MERVYVLTYSVVFDSSVTPWALAHQDLLSMGFSRQDDWSGLPFAPAGDLPDPEIETLSPVLAGGFFTTSVQFRRSFVSNTL